MINCIRTNAENRDFINLIQALDADLKILDGDEHAFYNQFNKVNQIKHAIVAYENDVPVGCGAIREFEPDTMEIKRMYVSLEKRGQGIATTILSELEQWAAALGYQKCVLETGKKQPEAIALYQKNGYNIIPNYGPYLQAENSVCFGKELAR